MFLSLFAHALLRIGLGGIFFYFGCRHLWRDKAEAKRALSHTSFKAIFWPIIGLEILIGALLIVGAYTQIAALGSLFFSIGMLFTNIKSDVFPAKTFYAIAIFASLSLFITGAGAFAFDLPI